MQNRTLLAAIATAALTAFAVPTVARAQDPKPTPQPPTQRDTIKRDTMQRDTTMQPPTRTSKGEVAMQPSYASLIRAIGNASASAEQLKAQTAISASNVQLVNVEDVLQGNSPDSLTAAVQQSDTAAVSALRSALGANTTISSALAANTPALTPADVVAADVSTDGKVTVYYWKKP